MRTHGERFGFHLSALRRSLTVGALALALSVGLMSAEAAPPPVPTSGALSSVPSSPPPSPPPSEAKPAAAAAAAAPAVSNAVYAYDAAGRLVGVTDPAGETARYRYDEAGNRLGIDRFASADLSVLSLVPTRAGVGATVTLSGTGFATTAAANAVSFGGKTAEVVSASATRLKVKVPAAAGNGKVSVTTGGGTAQSPESFTLAAPAPALTTMDPVSGAVGASVVLTGSGFAPTASENVVRFGGGVLAEVTARTATALTVKVPAGAATGPVEVETPDGRTTTATGFRVTVSGSNGEIESSVTTSVTDPTPPTASIVTPGNRAQVLFDADQGDDITFGFTNSTFNSSTALELYDPEGEKVGGNGNYSGTAGEWEVENLPLAGQYSLILKPGSSNFGAATVTLSKPVTGVVDLTGPTAQVPLTRAGQDGKLTFSALLGDSLSLGIDAAAMGKSLYARLYGPDGSQIVNRYVAANGAGAIDVDALSQSGTYTLRLDPDAAATGTVGVTGSHYADAGTLDPAAPAVELAVNRPGQDGRAQFAAVAGQRLSLGAAGTGFGSYVRTEIRRPDGSLLGYFLLPDNSSVDWDSPVLPESGTYTIAILPNLALATGRLTLTLSRPVELAPLSTTGDPVTATIGRFGQNAESAFQAQAGAQLSLGITGNTFTETAAVTVLAPSGEAVVDADSVSAGKSETIVLPELPETGAYQVIIDPNKGADGTLALTLSTDVAVPLTADGPSAPVAFARAGQRALAEFTAPDTASLGFAATDNSVPQATDVRLIPEGGTSQSVGSFTKNAAGAYYLSGLTPGKKYTLLLTPAAAATGSLTLWLSKPAPAAVLSSANPSATVDITRPGQQVELRTDATAGDGFAVVFSGTTLTAQSSVRHLPPGATADVSIGSLRTADLDLALRAPLTAGTHRVLVQPNEPATGRTTATLVKDVDGGTLTVGGPQKPLAITTPGGHGHFTFTGTKGQKLTLGIATPPSAWSLSLYGPDGKWLVNERSMGATTLSYALAALPADGLYTLTADPSVLKTGTFTLGLTGLALKAPATAGTRQNAALAGAGDETATDAPAKPTAGVDPSGPDAWRPGKQNRQGQDWITARGAAPKAPPALRAPPGSTALTGHVLKLDGKPLSKVTLSVGNKSARTDARGRFVLAGISPEATTLVVEGASANTEQRQYGRFDIRIRPKAGRSVDLGFPVWMTPLDTKHTVRFAAPAKTGCDRDTRQRGNEMILKP
ncbi:IPT/TIG domain-containing protein [Streptomyces sp. NPDC056835]|uniref:IPT/TIG domain-containing protein n=1 Tax=Streptomyces sp. NPDC056835 TaxID=3345956 RepID=UPI0036B33CF1